MTDYFGHWVNFREKLGYLAPKIFYANWFQADAEGRFIWPGSGENSRVLKWVCGHVDGTGKARPTPLGYLPTVDALDTDGIDTTPVEMAHLLSMDIEGWLKEIPEVCKYYHQFGERLPDILLHNLDELEGLLCGSATTVALTQSDALLSWVESMKQFLAPDAVHWCNGSDAEYNFCCDQLVQQGTFVRLAAAKHPNSFVAQSNPNDAVWHSKEVFVGSKNQEEVGPLKKKKKKLCHCLRRP